jgi:hypothetical protein
MNKRKKNKNIYDVSIKWKAVHQPQKVETKQSDRMTVRTGIRRINLYSVGELEVD